VSGLVIGAPASGAGKTALALALIAALGRLGCLVALCALGTGVAVAAAPVRIVSLAPSVTETLFALGAGPHVVAVSSFCDYPPEVAALPKVGSFLAPNVEAIIALRPDVVIGTPSPENRDAVMALRRLGVRVEIADPTHLADLPKVTRSIAAAAGIPEAGERLVAEIDRDMEAVRARVTGAAPRRVLMVVGHDPLIAVGRGSFLGELLEAARAVNVAPPPAAWPHVSIEYVIAADPEVVIDSGMGTEEGMASDGFWARFPSLTAVREGRIHAFHSYRVLRPGPRLAAAFADLARLIHPERWR
jgi:iron complex transport system substrate-binding protein